MFPIPSITPMKTTLHILCAGIFWIWNICFLLLVYGALLPLSGWGILVAMVDGTIPLPFVVSLFGLLLVPPLCTALGAWRLRKHPVLLMRLFYGVEAPLFGLCLLRMFGLRQTTPASTYVLVLAGVAIVTFGLELFFGYAAYKRPLAWFQIIAHSLVLMVGLYLGGLLLFYTVPAIAVFLYGFWFSGWLGNVLQTLVYNPIGTTITLTMGLFLFGFSCTLFLALPYVLVNLYLHSWGRIFSGFGRQYGWWKGAVVTGGVALMTLTLFVQTQTQPQIKAFDLLAVPPQTATAQQQLLDQTDTVRAGLVNAYLQGYRYLSPWEDSNALADWYRHLFDLTDDQAQFWQTWHNRLLSPFLYRGSRSDPDQAAQLYAQFFDQPIQKGERQAIQQALEATVNRDETKAGLLNIDQAIVFLARQEVTAIPQGDWANVTIYERYENNTWQDQEIFYSFSLPESAVITGLWLGDDQQPQRFPFVVSPRGAAQQVYNQEVERGQRQPAVDPALLEQVGPRQYRLRVFPIPQQVTSTQPGRTHLWLTYTVLQQDGQWPLPQLTERRSIFWTAKTPRLRDGHPVKLEADQWFEAGIPIQAARSPQSHQVVLPGGYRVTATPVTNSPPALTNQHLAVVVDSSYSMAQQSQTLAQTIKTLAKLEPHNTVDWMIAKAPALDPQVLDQPPTVKHTIFYGSLQLADMMQQFARLKADQAYDGVIFVTDAGSYELARTQVSLPSPVAPYWVLHLGGQLPPAYEDSVLQSIQTSRGGVDTAVDNLLQRMATASPNAWMIDGYQWRVEATTAPSSSPQPPGLVPLATRQLIHRISREQDLSQLAALDQVHGLAINAAIVTPYSSMLVLVNDEQRQRLRQAELADSRFDRQVEDGNDQLTQPNNLLSNPTSVPEPSSVLVWLGFAGALILWRRPSQKAG